MMQRPISDGERTPLRVTIVTLDSHLASAVDRARGRLARDWPALSLTLHAAAEWGADETALAHCLADIAAADIVIVTMLFMEEHIRPVMPALLARRETCDAMICVMSAPEVARLTRMGRLKMGEGGGALSFLKKLRGKDRDKSAGAGARQMKMLRRLPKILRFIPGTAQDLRIYFLSLQYFLAGSDDNVANMVRMLVDRYADGPRKVFRGKSTIDPPVEYPEVGVYHPHGRPRLAETLDALPRVVGGGKGRVGVLILRSYVLAGNSRHYDAVIDALNAQGLDVVPAFASGLDARPAIERFFLREGKPTIDALVSLTGFSLVGGPAYNDAAAAEEVLAGLDVPYLGALPVEFQSLEQWEASERGLLPVEATMMVAIPELDGATGSMVFGGRSERGEYGGRDMVGHPDRVAMLARRVARLVALRKKPRRERRVGIVLFNFPPNAGNVGTAAFLGVFESLFNTLTALKAEGYAVDFPDSVDALRERLLVGNAARHSANANVHARISASDHVRREPWLAQIEAQWGPAPGRHQSDGQSIQILGERFGEVFVGIQPSFGYEGDPMRLLFESGFAPTHAFCAFYRWLREDFGADAVLHFGTHGALEFMPGKQAGMSGACWPDRLIGDLPNIYLYAANNASEGTIAKRRAAATLVSYMTPPIGKAGLYRGLLDLKASIDRWRRLEPENARERDDVAAMVQAQAAALDLGAGEPAWGPEAEARIAALSAAVLELEYTLIPHGLHVVGAVPSREERIELIDVAAEGRGIAFEPAVIAALVDGEGAAAALSLDGRGGDEKVGAVVEELARTARHLAQDHEIGALVHALDGGFIRPAPAGDLIRTPDMLPTGRNLHGFDPYRIPSAFAVADGARQAERLIARHLVDGNPPPETIAIVLWGTDNLKTEGGPIGQALAFLGARPRFDAYGRLAGAELIPLDELRRPRIDVMMTLSGIFRDLLPLQVRLLAEAAYLAAAADEPESMNAVRRHALAHMAAHGCDLETAALRVFSNADGTYGANVNNLVVNGGWDDEDEIAETYTRRKCFAYGRSGKAVKNQAMLEGVLANVDLAYQNLDSVELGVTTVDQYFDTLGGISRAVTRARGGEGVPVYIGDQTRGEGVVRTLGEQVALETRTRVLNPKWYEGMLQHGYEGVRQIEEHVTNTMGWSATTGQVAPWVYQRVSELYVLDPAMRDRLAALNTTASARLANRLIEAHERNYWTPDPETLALLREAGEDLEDRVEGVFPGRAA